VEGLAAPGALVKVPVMGGGLQAKRRVGSTQDGVVAKPLDVEHWRSELRQDLWPKRPHITALAPDRTADSGWRSPGR
jgi:hypothetical protein